MGLSRNSTERKRTLRRSARICERSKSDKHYVEFQTDHSDTAPIQRASGVWVPMLRSETGTITLRIDGPNPILRWSIIAGDVIGNLSCALDYVVWELYEAYKGP